MVKRKSSKKLPPALAAKIRALASPSASGPAGVGFDRSPPPVDSQRTTRSAPPPAQVASSDASLAVSSAVGSDPVISNSGTRVPPAASASSPAASLAADLVSPPRPSWRDMAKGTPHTMSKKGTPFLLESGEWCVKISNDVISRNQRKWEPFIVGQFHGNLPSHGALHAILNGIWSSKRRDITLSRLGPKTALIKVPCPATRARVLAQGMWHIEGQTMFVADYSPGFTPQMPELVEAPVWLELRGVPPHFFNEESLEHVAGLVGDPLYLHPSTANLTDLVVAKVFTIIDLQKPLPEAVNAQFETGEIVRVEVSCPWLPPTCTFCHEVGHTIRRCPTAPITCTSCKSTTHMTEVCPRNKRSETKKEKYTKKGPLSEAEAEADIPSSSKDPQKSKSKKAKKAKKAKRDLSVPPSVKNHKDYLASPEETLAQQRGKEKAERKKKKKKKKAPSSDSGLSSSSESSGAEHIPDTSSASASDAESVEESDPGDDIEYTTVLSKKGRRAQKQLQGKHPKSNPRQ